MPKAIELDASLPSNAAKTAESDAALSLNASKMAESDIAPCAEYTKDGRIRGHPQAAAECD